MLNEHLREQMNTFSPQNPLSSSYIAIIIFLFLFAFQSSPL